MLTSRNKIILGLINLSGQLSAEEIKAVGSVATFKTEGRENITYREVHNSEQQ